MRDVFPLYLDDYFAEMGSLAYRDLKRRQDGLHAGLAFGAAGVAYALWYGGVLRRDAALLARADRLLASAARGATGARAFLTGDAPPGASVPAGSLLHGRAGLPFVQALVACARGHEAAQERALVRFLALCRAPAANPSLYTGSAGCLAAAAQLLRQTGDRRLREAISEITRQLAEQATFEPNGSADWSGLAGPALAHGRTGVHLALFLGAAASDTPPPPWLGAATAVLLRGALAAPESFCPRPSVYGWLCNGVLGLALLAVHAYEALGDPEFLEGARTALLLSLANLPGRADLCCGRAGAAFVALALARIDPDVAWRRQAAELALSTLLVERPDWSVAGLYGGEAAIPCLVLALQEGIDAGPPVFDLTGPLAAPL